MNHEVYKTTDGYAYRCSDWNMSWYFHSQDDAAYFLSAHLAMPVAPCRGTPENADERRCLGCDEPWQVPGTTVCQTCIVAAQDAALARQDADRG